MNDKEYATKLLSYILQELMLHHPDAENPENKVFEVYETVDMQIPTEEWAKMWAKQIQPYWNVYTKLSCKVFTEEPDGNYRHTLIKVKQPEVVYK